jgi:hypothetical protein
MPAPVQFIGQKPPSALHFLGQGLAQGRQQALEQQMLQQIFRGDSTQQQQFQQLMTSQLPMEQKQALMQMLQQQQQMQQSGAINSLEQQQLMLRQQELQNAAQRTRQMQEELSTRTEKALQDRVNIGDELLQQYFRDSSVIYSGDENQDQMIKIRARQETSEEIRKGKNPQKAANETVQKYQRMKIGLAELDALEAPESIKWFGDSPKQAKKKIDKAMKLGVTADIIRERMLEKGWPEKEINKLLPMTKEQKQEMQKKQSLEQLFSGAGLQ